MCKMLFTDFTHRIVHFGDFIPATPFIDLTVLPHQEVRPDISKSIWKKQQQ